MEEFEADEAAADREEGFVDVGAAFVADAEAAVLMQPGDRSLDDPAASAEPGSVRPFWPGDLRLDVPSAQFVLSLPRVVGAVAVQRARAAARSAAASVHGWDRVDEREHLGDVVAVAAGERDGEWRAAAAGDQVVLGAASGAVDGAGAGLVAPPKARTCELSIAARSQSINSAWCSLTSSSSCSRCHTPACCHSRSRRQQVTPEPQPISCGKYSHGIPVCSTNKIPVSTLRSSIRFLPGKRCRLGTFGISGSTSSHNSSDTNTLAICAPKSKWTQPTSPTSGGSLLRGLPLPGAGRSDDWQQQIDDVPTPIELDAGTRAVTIRARREPFERRTNEAVDVGRFASQANTCVATSR